MPTIERVSIDDVFPWEDEYGNQFLSRDYSTRENQRYVERLAESMRAKGVPDEPVQLSRDGGIYRIVSGNSRVRAMRLLGTKSFDAVVLDDAEAEEAMRRAVEVTVRTNTKKTYDPVEESRFVQQLAMFADDQYVAEAAGIDPDQVRRVRRGRRAVGDGAEDMTLAKLAAIAEFEDDPEAVRRISECKDREVDWVVRNLRSEAERAVLRAAIRAALETAGLTLLGQPPAGAIWCAYVVDPEGVPETGGPRDPTIAVAHGNGNGYSLYRMPSAEDTEEEAEEASRKREIELRRAGDRERAAAGMERRRAWLVDRLTNFDPARMPSLCDLAVANLVDEYCGADEAHGALIDAGARPTVGSLCVLASAMQAEPPEGLIWTYSSGRAVSHDSAHRYMDLLDAMRDDGYEPSEDEMSIYEEAAKAIGREW